MSGLGRLDLGILRAVGWPGGVGWHGHWVFSGPAGLSRQGQLARMSEVEGPGRLARPGCFGRPVSLCDYPGTASFPDRPHPGTTIQLDPNRA